MTGKEQGFLLLTSTLGVPDRHPLTTAQFRTLATRVAMMEKPEMSRDLLPEDLQQLGYDVSTSLRIISLLGDEEVLDKYLRGGAHYACVPITRITEGYPLDVRQRLGLDAPGCLWAKGDLAILKQPKVSLVGCRDLRQPNELFAELAGYEAARQGYVLVSGNARGADRTAQEACLRAGGSVICVVADELHKYPLRENVLYLSEDSFDLPFSAIRALSRNRVIHALGSLTLVAQCSDGIGGTWDGTVRNLRGGYSPVYCFNDGSAAMLDLQAMGATLIAPEQLMNLSKLQPDIKKLI